MLDVNSFVIRAYRFLPTVFAACCAVVILGGHVPPSEDLATRNVWSNVDLDRVSYDLTGMLRGNLGTIHDPARLPAAG